MPNGGGLHGYDYGPSFSHEDYHRQEAAAKRQTELWRQLEPKVRQWLYDNLPSPLQRKDGHFIVPASPIKVEFPEGTMECRLLKNHWNIHITIENTGWTIDLTKNLFAEHGPWDMQIETDKSGFYTELIG